MSRKPSASRPENHSAAARIDAIRDRFESVWNEGGVPRIEDFVQEERDAAEARQLLTQLVAVDMEYRWRRAVPETVSRRSPPEETSPPGDGSQQRLSLADYVVRYPALGQLEGLPEELIVQEYRLRQLFGNRPSPEEYVRSFPTRAEQLLARLGEADSASSPLKQRAGGVGDARPGARPGRIGDYELLEEIARGGMGVVYRSRQIRLNRIVALKMILAGRFADQDEVRRFRAEAEAAATLDHPGIVPIYEAGEFEGQHFFSMGYVQGESLSRRLAAGPLPPLEAARLMLQVAEAVAYAHRRGVIHRDLKPANILLDQDGHPRITDFGLAKRISVESGLTMTGQVLGTPSYMPPEQAAGKIEAVGPQSDVYSLGATLYALLTGRPPHQAAGAVQTLQHVMSQEPVPLRQLNAAVPIDLETICLKCLQKEPPRRYHSAEEFAGELGRFLAGEPIHARPVSRAERARRWCKRKPAAAAVVALTFFLLTVVVPALLLFQVRLTRTRAEKDQEALRANAESQRAATQEYYSLVGRVAQRNARRPPGWTWLGLQELALAAGLPTESRDPLELRNHAVVCLGGVDLREKQVLGQGLKSSLLAFSPDGKLLAAAPNRASAFLACPIQVFDLSGGQVVSRFDYQPSMGFQLKAGVPDGPRQLLFSPDGRWLVVGSRSGMIQSWDLRDQPKSSSWQAHTGDVRALAFNKDGQVLYSSGDTSVKSWSLARPGKELAVFLASKQTGGLVLDPASQDRLAIAVSDMNRVLFLDPVTLQKQGEGSELMGYALFALPSRSPVTAYWHFDRAGLGGLDEVAGPRWLSEDGSGSTHLGEVSSLSCNPDGSLLASTAGGDDDGTLKLWEAASGKLLASIFLGAISNDIRCSFSPDGATLAVTGEQKVILYEVGGLAALTYVGSAPGPVVTARFRKQGQGVALLATKLGGWAQVSLWDTARGRLLATQPFVGYRGNLPKVLAAHPQGESLAFGGLDCGLWFWPYPEKPDRLGAQCDRIACFSRDGLSLWGLQEPHAAFSWDIQGNRERTRWTNNAGWITGRGSLLSIAAGQRRVLVGGRDGAVRVLRATDGQLEEVWPGSLAGVTALALNDDETLAALGTQQGRVRIARVPQGEISAELEGHEKGVDTLALATTPEGAYLASGSKDRTIRLWRQQDQSFQHVLTLPAGSAVQHLEFSPDGNQLLVVLENEYSARIWRLDRLRSGLRSVGLDW